MLNKRIETEETSPRSRKTEVEELLQKDYTFHSFISECLEKSQRQTDEMVTILTSVDTRFEHLGNVIIPLHGQTDSLLHLNKTLKDTLFYVDDAISHYQVTHIPDNIVFLGLPHKLHDHMLYLQQIKKAVEYFTEDNPDGPELNLLFAKLDRAVPPLEFEFKALVMRYCIHVTPNHILERLAMAEFKKCVAKIDIFSKSGLDYIITVANWLTEYRGERKRREDAMPLTTKKYGSLNIVSKIKTLSLNKKPALSKTQLSQSKSMGVTKPQEPVSLFGMPRSSTSYPKVPLLKTLCDFKALPLVSKAVSASTQLLINDSVVSEMSSANCPSMSALKSLDKKPPSIEVPGPLESNSATFPRMSGLKSICHRRYLSLDRKASLDNEPSLNTGRSKSSSGQCLSSRLKIRTRDRLTHPEPGHLKPTLPLNLMSIYCQQRSSTFCRSMKELKNHFSCGSFGNHLSPAVHNTVMESPCRKSQQTGGHSVLDVEAYSYRMSVQAFPALALAEYNALSKVFPREDSENLMKNFNVIVQEALQILVQDGDSIILATKRASSCHELTALAALLPILDGFQTYVFKRASLVKSAMQFPKLTTLNFNMRTTVNTTLWEFVSYIKSSPDKNMPKDGTVHELTRNTIMFLQHLLLYKINVNFLLCPQVEEIGIPNTEEASTFQSSQEDLVEMGLLSQEDDQRVKRRKDKAGGKPKEDTPKLRAYICEALENLRWNLQNKAKVYEDHALRAIFLLNNFNYLLKSLKKSELFNLVKDNGRDPEVLYSKLIEEQRQVHQHRWRKLAKSLSDKNLPKFKQGDKLKDKDRQLIKDKFKAFNEGFEELCKAQEGWALPDPELSAAIWKAQKELLSKAYPAFLHRCEEVAFSKHPERYRKYCPKQVDEKIDRLFNKCV